MLALIFVKHPSNSVRPFLLYHLLCIMLLLNRSSLGSNSSILNCKDSTSYPAGRSCFAADDPEYEILL